MMNHKHNHNIKGHKLLRLGCGVASAAMLLGGALSTSALTPTYRTMSDAFDHSRYYLNLQCLCLTGDARTDMVMIAMSQLGYHEGDCATQTNGENKTGEGNYVEYNYLNGAVDQYGTGQLTYGYPWCASFVTYCARMAGIDECTVPSSVNCARWVQMFRAQGTYHERGDGYIPQKGDLIFFRSEGSPKLSTHVGIVRYTCNGVVYTIEGNLHDEVSLAAYGLNDSYIIGYASPNYRENTATAYTYLLDAYGEGNYIIAAQNLPVYSEVGGGKQTFMLHRGDLMHIYEARGMWGRTDYGWIHLPDTQPVDVR
ncbi:MAG: CHAP domain-containing protein [Clostridia bacterium]|nr:CHAP domain-containing protein [Clostridia bacterium]MBQ7339174.1 CHAP domain-containing protein [Clostridia bacterium]